MAVTVAVLCCGSMSAAAQEFLTRKGNELYSKGKYAEASMAYLQALQQHPTFTPGAFNLGNALVQQKQYEAARKVMANTAKTTKDPLIKSGANYNTGNTFMSEQQWQPAVDAYKESLRKNPQDADAKYNLSYALAKLRKQQEEQKKGGGGDGKQDKDGKEEKDQQKKDDKNSKQQQNQSNGDSKQQQRPQPQQSKISEQQADNLLKALQQDERKVQDKMQQGKATPVRLEKDW